MKIEIEPTSPHTARNMVPARWTLCLGNNQVQRIAANSRQQI